jgi:hypothetical protein
MVNKSTNISKTNNHFSLELTEENKTKRPLNMNGKLAQNGLGQGDRRGVDRMIIGFTTTHDISDYHHYCCDFESRL